MRASLFLVLCVSFATPAASQYSLPGKVRGDNNVTVVVFIATDCPISQKYIPALNEIHKRYDGKMNFYSVIPGKVKIKSLKKFIQEYDITFTVTPDKKYDRVKALGASVTPQVFVFDRRDALKYHGAIDNWFYELGGYRNKPTENYLIDAIESVLAEKDPKTESTKALGCFIQIP